MKYVTAREIMSAPVLTVRPDTPIREIAGLMLRSEVTGLPVVDDEMRVLGIVTEDDLLRREGAPLAPRSVISPRVRPLWLERVLEQYQAAEAATAQQLMTAYVETAAEDTPARDLARLMLSRKINRVLILRDGRLVGIVDTGRRTQGVRAQRPSAGRRRRATHCGTTSIWTRRIWSISCENGIVTVAGEVARHSDRALAVKWIRTIDGVVGVDADALTFRVDDLALGQVVR